MQAVGLVIRSFRNLADAVLDLPPEESATYDALTRAAGLAAIYLVAPTTPEDRVAAIVSHGLGPPRAARAQGAQ